MAYTNIEDQRRYHREYIREQRQAWKQRGLCRDCGREDAFTMVGRYRCADCTERHNEQKRDRAKSNAYARTLRVERRELGLCTQCGSSLPSRAYPFVMCEACRARDRVKQENKRRESGIVPKWLYAEIGVCVKCGRPRMNGVTAWGGDEIKLCERCYNDASATSAKGRLAYKEKHGATWGQKQYGQKGASAEVR